MILIDTDHATFFKYPASDRGRRFIQRLKSMPESEVIGISIVTIEERMRGWLAAIAKEKSATRQVFAYRELAGIFEFYREFEVVQFDDSAARQFEDFRKQRIRLATMDLKIASTAVSNKAILLSANLTDFSQVPSLQVENWLD